MTDYANGYRHGLEAAAVLLDQVVAAAANSAAVAERQRAETAAMVLETLVDCARSIRAMKGEER